MQNGYNYDSVCLLVKSLVCTFNNNLVLYITCFGTFGLNKTNPLFVPVIRLTLSAHARQGYSSHVAVFDTEGGGGEGEGRENTRISPSPSCPPKWSPTLSSVKTISLIYNEVVKICVPIKN